MSEPTADSLPAHPRTSATAVAVPGHEARFTRSIGWVMLIGSIGGLVASFGLTVETVLGLIDPTRVPSCSINPIVDCGKAMTSEHGFLIPNIPNSLLGVVAYAVLAGISVCVLVGSRLPKWIWACVTVAMLGAFAFVHYLFYTSVFELKTLCPYCMVVWIFTLPLVIYTILHVLSAGYLGGSESTHRKAGVLADYHVPIVVIWFGVFAVLILVVLWDSWVMVMNS